MTLAALKFSLVHDDMLEKRLIIELGVRQGACCRGGVEGRKYAAAETAATSI